MINKISFAGREGCLTQPMKKASVNYIPDSAIISDAVTKTVKKTSLDVVDSKALNDAYRAAHAPYVIDKTAVTPESHKFIME